MALVIDQFMCREDNFGVLVHNPETGATIAIDAPEAAPIEARLKANRWTLTDILVTHHHADHVDGIPALKRAWNATVTGPEKEASGIPALDRTTRGGDTLTVDSVRIEVLDTPGHTLGHITYWLPEAQTVFTADALFSLGCGRVIEGTAEMLWDSLQRIAALPDETAVYCGHEYTAANARFALTIEPDNAALQARAAEVEKLRTEGRPTLPTTIRQEKATNPFLRAAEAGIRARLGMESASDAEVFAEIRRRKDSFR